MGAPSVTFEAAKRQPEMIRDFCTTRPRIFRPINLMMFIMLAVVISSADQALAAPAKCDRYDDQDEPHLGLICS